MRNIEPIFSLNPELEEQKMLLHAYKAVEPEFPLVKDVFEDLHF